MTSTYDGIHDEDLPGFLCVKTQFWDKSHSDVDVYIRRRTFEGDWIWLASRAVSYVTQPIPGMILKESIVQDEDEAQRLNRLTRITAILVQAVEAAQLTAARKTTPSDGASNSSNGENSPIPTDDATAYRTLMESINATGAHMPDQEQAIQHLMHIAASGGNNSKNGEHKLEREFLENVAGLSQRKKFDPFSIMESVRQGVRLDLGLTHLEPEEVKMISLVLSGKLPVEDVAPLVLYALKTGQGLASTLSNYRLDSERARHTLTEEGTKLSEPLSSIKPLPPPIAVVNLSYTYIGNTGIEMLSEILYKEGSTLKVIDISFCTIEEKGMLALARALAKRKRDRITPLKGVILSGNYMSSRAAAEFGTALSLDADTSRKQRRTKSGRKTGYESDSTDEDDTDEDDFVNARKRRNSGNSTSKSKKQGCNRCEKDGLQVLHVAHSSMSAKTLSRLLDGLGEHCSVRELNLSSNDFGANGAAVLARFLEGKPRSRDHVPMPVLDRIDMSNNSFGDDGATQLTRVISKRAGVHLVDLRLSSNAIGPGGIETIMNKLLQHNLVSLSLDKNNIGDQGCQLVAASLQSMQSLCRLNLGFNHIGSRGINSLMRSLILCESVIYLGLSGNILKISGAIALAFTLTQHPRLEELDLDNCCLGQAAQCHITAGIISNRWVPLKQLRGYAVGPPMVAIGALKPYAQSLSNDECFRIRRNEQMNTILQWQQSNRLARERGDAGNPNLVAALNPSDSANQCFLTPDFVRNINEVQGTPSQNAYYRLLGWLSRIPFDDDELTALQKYFYDPDGGEGDRGEDGYINLKLRGDLLAALDSEVAEEIREDLPTLLPSLKGSVGIDLDKIYDLDWNSWQAFKGYIFDPQPLREEPEEASGITSKNDNTDETLDICENDGSDDERQGCNSYEADSDLEQANEMRIKSSNLARAKASLQASDSGKSLFGKEKKSNKVKPRITMFPQFEQQLEELKVAATEMIEQEDDPMQHEIILTQYAEASLTILRQLRYHCMNSGLDGWRQGETKRKVLIIDDSTVTRKLVSRAFEKANFIVDTASNGAEGVEKLKASIYDIAFMDIDMPVMNGFEATKKLREWEDKMRPGARQPICALTATYVDDFERSELMKFKEAGLDVMESKPCNIPRLFKVVDDVSPMFSDLSISVIQRERSDSKLSDATK